jgi:hypothetical protein
MVADARVALPGNLLPRSMKPLKPAKCLKIAKIAAPHGFAGRP